MRKQTIPDVLPRTGFAREKTILYFHANEMPQVPPHLSHEAKVEWERVSQQLYQLGLLSNIDRAALAAYCEAWSDFVDASKKCIGEYGADRKVLRGNGENAGYFENPYFTIKKRSMELMKSFLTEFSMTPASRTRINAEPKEKGKPNSRWSNHGVDR
jgi:P27 family predicted phage terminase small subunit